MVYLPLFSFEKIFGKGWTGEPRQGLKPQHGAALISLVKAYHEWYAFIIRTPSIGKIARFAIFPNLTYFFSLSMIKT